MCEHGLCLCDFRKPVCSLQPCLRVVGHMGISSAKCKKPYTEQIYFLQWRFNLCRGACQRQINIQRKTYMQGHNAQTVAESCRVKCSLFCVWGAGWQSVPEKPMGDLQDSWMELRLLSHTNWAAGHLFSFSVSQTLAEKVSVHTRINGLAEGKRRNLNVQCEVGVQVIALSGDTDCCWNTDTL